MTTDLTHYADLLGDIKTRIRHVQIKATLSANAEMILMYWDIGRMITERQQHEGWGTAIIPRLAADLKNELPEVKGFSERNIRYMIRFAHEYGASPILQQPVAKLSGSSAESNEVPQSVAQMPPNDLSTNLQQLVAKIPWGHNIMLMEKVKELSARLWYMQQTIEQGWSCDTLAQMIKNSAHKRQGKAVTNFQQSLPSSQSDLARQLLKDLYIFDFLTIEEPFQERELETGLVRHLERFLLELGQGFAFVFLLRQPLPHETPEEEAGRCYSLRSLERFAEFFGLAEIEHDPSKRFTADFSLRKLPLLHHVVQFNL